MKDLYVLYEIVANGVIVGNTFLYFIIIWIYI